MIRILIIYLILIISCYSSEALQEYSNIDKAKIEIQLSNYEENEMEVNQLLNNKLLKNNLFDDSFEELENENIEVPLIQNKIAINQYETLLDPELDIVKIKKIIENESNVIDNISKNLPVQKCEIYTNIISAISKFKYSKSINYIISKLTDLNLECINKKMKDAKVFSNTSFSYFNHWCIEVKNKEMCMDYFNTSWLTKASKCNENSECKSYKVADDNYIYLSRTDSVLKNEIDFFTRKINHFSFVYKNFLNLNSDTLCLNNYCSSKLDYCEKSKISSELFNLSTKKNLNNCQENQDCQLFIHSEIYYTINKNSSLKYEPLLNKLIDDTVNYCKTNIGTLEPTNTLTPKNTEAPIVFCLKNKCSLVNKVP